MSDTPEDIGCLDGPTDLFKPPKRKLWVENIEELEKIVDQLIATGDTNVKLDFSPALLLEPRAYDILERIVSDHPRSQPNGRSPKRPPEAEAEAEAEAEIVSYVEGALEPRTHRGFTFQVYESAEGYRMKVDLGCRGWEEPFDCAFQTIEAADETGTGYIDHLILQAEQKTQ